MSIGMALGLTALALAASAATAPTAPRSTHVTKITGGQLDWRFAASLQDIDPSERPAIKVGDGAVQQRDGSIRFPAAGGTYDAVAGTATAKYRGTLSLGYPDGTITLANPTVAIDATGATMRADIDTAPSRAARATAPVVRESTARQAGISDLQTFGVAPEAAERTVTWHEVPATLTAAGAAAFPGDTQSEGTSLGPVTFAMTLAEAVPAPPARAAATTTSPTATDSGTTSASPDPTDCASESTSPSETATTATPTSTATDTTSATPCPTSTADDTAANGDTSGDAPGSGGSGDGDSLAKTGGKLLPLLLAGGVLTVAGGATMVLARRRMTAV